MKDNTIGTAWQAGASATLVGSMPHKDRKKVIDLIIAEMSEIPVWPQLSTFPPEQMIYQYIEGLPGVRLKNGGVILETDTPEFEQELYSFYEEYIELEGDAKDLVSSRFKMGPETGKTFQQFLDILGSLSLPLRAVKGQVVGPFTLLTGLKDQNDRALLYDERMQDVVPKHLAMKARWQANSLKRLGHTAIVFLDEPALAGFGSSAFISVSRELVQQLLREVVVAVHEEGALAGIHICANTDWMLAFESGVDIINFDAYNYLDKFALYRTAFSKFIDQGNTVAWGLIPTGDPSALLSETASSLADRWLDAITDFTAESVSVSKILSQSLFTPSCGCGSLSESLAERVIRITREVSEILRKHL